MILSNNIKAMWSFLFVIMELHIGGEERRAEERRGEEQDMLSLTGTRRERARNREGETGVRKHFPRK